MRERENERREGKVREKMVEVLRKIISGRDHLEKLEGKNLAESLHKKIGGPVTFCFCDMFRELHRLWLVELERSGPAFELAKEIYFSAHSLDIAEFRDRRE